jgi:hypothetical protein
VDAAASLDGRSPRWTAEPCGSQCRRFEVPAEAAANLRQELQIESGTGESRVSSALCFPKFATEVAAMTRELRKAGTSRPKAGVKLAKPFASDGGNNAWSPRARRKPLKPSRREGRVHPVEPVVTCLCASSIRTQGCGCGQRPAFPAPSLARGSCWKTSDAGRVARTRSCFWLSDR